MKFWIAVVIAIALSMVLKVNFWVTLIILFLINYFSHFLSFRRNSVSNQYVSQIFFLVTFEVLGHISKAKGRVTKNDIQIALTVMDAMHLRGQIRQAAQQAFNRGKNAHYPLRQKLQEFYRYYTYNRELIWFFLEIQVQAALSDGQLDVNEHKILHIIAGELKIPPQELEQLIRMMQGSERFQQDNNKSATATLNDAYSVLNVSANDDEQTIKRAYRRLMNQHHPDKLMSKGVPPEMLELAKKKTQEIQAAYDLIRQAHGF